MHANGDSLHHNKSPVPCTKADFQDFAPIFPYSRAENTENLFFGAAKADILYYMGYPPFLFFEPVLL